jgi:hypothetical protein
MELEYLLMKLTFSDEQQFAHPVATVRARPKGTLPTQFSGAVVDIRLSLADVIPACADLPAIAAEALRQAQALLQPEAAVRLLQATLDREAAERAKSEADMAAIFQTPPA